MRVTPIWGAYHLPAAERPKIPADTTWSTIISQSVSQSIGLGILTRSVVRVAVAGRSVGSVGSKSALLLKELLLLSCLRGM
jgi:hypothetical protein